MNNKQDLKPKEKKTWGDKVGSVVEKAGHKISDMGAPNLGQKVHDLGDSMETHHKNPNHPHKV